MYTYSRRFVRKHRRGVAAVEAACLAPLVILFVMIVCEVGWYVNCAQTVNNAARRGARAAVYHENSNAEVEAAVRNSLSNAMNIDPNAVTVRISHLTASGDEDYQVMNLNENEHGEMIRVMVSVDYGEMGLGMSLLGLNGGDLTSYAVMQRHK